MGRVNRTFHPSLFGCHVVVSVRAYRDWNTIERTAQKLVSQTLALVLGGIVAWLLAEYGNAHWAGVLSALDAHRG